VDGDLFLIARNLREIASCPIYRFVGRDVKGERVALPAGDYAVANAEATIAVVERKTLENFTASLSDGTLAFQMQRLGEVAAAAVVVEGSYSALFTLEHVPRLHRRWACSPTGALPRDPGYLRGLEEVR
jgi:ERCC4-type nuclease